MASQSLTSKVIFQTFSLAFFAILGSAQIVSIQSYNSPDIYIRHRYGVVDATKLFVASEQLDFHFAIVKGLADPNEISFESVNFPGLYVRHSGFRMRLQLFENNRRYREDATFKPVRGNVPSKRRDLVSFQSFNFPTRFIRQRNSKLWIDEISTTKDKADSTWIVVIPRTVASTP